jgi:hypothetical protein
MESAAAARQHFYLEHPSAEKVMKDPGEHMIEVERAVGRCRAALREANRLAGAHEDADQSDESELKAPENVFRKEGTMWFASFNGESNRFRRLKGCEDIALVLEQGETGVSVITLASDVDAAMDGASFARGSGEGLSVAGAAQPKPVRVQQKVWDEGLREIEAKAEDAEARGDHEAAAEARKQHEKLSALRAGAYGLGGRERDNSAPVEKARQMVKARISRARKRIAETMPRFATHLEQSIKSKGGTFTYCPESPTEWLTR